MTDEIEGRNLDPTFWTGLVREYQKTATVLAAQMGRPGVVHTPEGDMRYEAGDYLVTDNPPTHCWPVKGEVFESTYKQVAEHFYDR